MKLEDNNLYIHRITGYCFWYCNNEFVTMNEKNGKIETYTEKDMESNYQYLDKIEDNLKELNLENDF